MVIAVSILLVLATVLPFWGFHQLWVEQQFQAALEEQVRKENANHIDYPNDLRLRAIQQRLSRKFGKKAFSERMVKKVQKQIAAHPVLGPWHRE